MSNIVRKLEKHPGWGIVEAGPETAGTVPTGPVVVNGLIESPFAAQRRRPEFLDTGPRPTVGSTIPSAIPLSSSESGSEQPLYMQYMRLKESMLGFLGGHSTPPALNTQVEIPAILGNMLRASINTQLISSWSVIDSMDKTGEFRTDLILDGAPRQEGEKVVTPRIIAHLAWPEELLMGESGEVTTVQYSPIASLSYSLCIASL